MYIISHSKHLYRAKHDNSRHVTSLWIAVPIKKEKKRKKNNKNGLFLHITTYRDAGPYSRGCGIREVEEWCGII